MTVRDLKKALKGISDKTPVYMADHDHGTYETAGPVTGIKLLDQGDPPAGDEWQIDMIESIFKIEGSYLCLRE